MMTGGRLIKHARYYWLLLAESHLTRRLFGAMVRGDRIDRGCWHSIKEKGTEGQMEVA